MHIYTHTHAHAPPCCPCAQSPGHGEDDWRVCMAHGVVVKRGPLPCPVDLEGRFLPEVSDFAGKWVQAQVLCFLPHPACLRLASE